MTPAPRLLALVGLLLVAAIVEARGLIGSTAWTVLLAAVLFLALFDMLMTPGAGRLRCERRVPGSLPLGTDVRVDLRVHNDGSGPLRMALYDHYPRGFQGTGLPRELAVEAGHWGQVGYRVRPVERGEHRFGRLQARVVSPLGLWWRDARLGRESTVRVYPNFAAVSRYALVAMEQRLSQIGVLQQRRRGEGSEFHQLREYRSGDELRQVDWRATARARRLISREYQEEQDQRVVFLLDCGRRMRSQDRELSHFDQALNAVLLLSYVALRKGDSVGVGSFAGEPRWLRPAKGHATLNRILNLLYDLQPSTEIPDYAKVAVDMLARQRKRALVVILTNLRDEDAEDLRAAVGLLTRRHLVLVASLREQAVGDVLGQEVSGFADALRVAAAHRYLQEREEALEAIQASGMASLDVQPEELSLELVNAYLAIKARGAL